MSSNRFQRLSLVLLLALFVPALQIDWQGTGNMTNDNMTEIHSSIANNPIGQFTSPSNIDTIAQTISTRLNTLWDPAWNVLIIKNGPGLDAVLYGYAFRGHWMWINGVPFSSERKLTYIIWKDYNCHTWGSVNSLITGPTSFTAGDSSTISSLAFVKIRTDIWSDAKFLIDYLEDTLTDAGRKRGYSVIMSQDDQALYQGYICLYNSNYYLKRGIDSSTYGSFFMFQTRQ